MVAQLIEKVTLGVFSGLPESKACWNGRDKCKNLILTMGARPGLGSNQSFHGCQASALTN